MVQMINENDALSKFFDIVYTEFTNREKTKREINFIKSHIDIGKVILDIGCGTGRHLIPLTKMRFNVVGIDNSKGMLGILKEKLENGGLTAELIFFNILEIKRFDRRFGGIICFFNALCEIAKDDDQANSFFNLAARSLEDGGKLIIQQHNAEEPTNFNPENFNAKSKKKKGNKEYSLSYTLLKYNKDTNITVSKEFIQMEENKKIIKKIENKVIQKWWRMAELEKHAKESGFRHVSFYGDDFLPFNVNSEEIIMVAEK